MPTVLPGLIAIAATVRRAGREPSGGQRNGWLMLAAALSLYTFGLIIWGYDTVVYAAIPFPTIADALLLIFPWLMVAALFQLMGSQLTRTNRARVVINTLVVLFSLGLIEWSLFLRHSVEQTGTVLALLAAVMYPLGDLIMLGGVAFALQQAWDPERRMFLLPILLGVGLFVVGDSIYAVQIASGNYHAATPLDLTWSFGLALFALAALRHAPTADAHATTAPVTGVLQDRADLAASKVILLLTTAASLSLIPLFLQRQLRLPDIIIAVAVLIGLGVLLYLRYRLETQEKWQLNVELQRANEQLNGRVTLAVSALEARNVELAQQTQQLGQRNEEIQAFGELADLLQACLTLEEARVLLVQAADRLLVGTRGSIAVINASRNLIETFAVWGEEREQATQVFAPQDCWALRRGHPHLLQRDVGHLGVACQPLAGNLPNWYLCLPLVAQGETLGVLRMSSDGGPTQDQTALRGAAQNMARQVALALANLQLRETLRRQSIRDTLTGLHNRRYLEETLERELHRALRAERPLSVLLFDVDHFKKFNDTFGHAAGDAVLQEVSKVMRQMFREEDVICRYGGEEFVVVLMDTDQIQALRRAEQLRVAVEQLKLTFREQVLGTVSISLGIAVLTLPAMKDIGSDELIRLADEALYQAKRSGRNRVVVSEPLGSSFPGTAAAGPLAT